jgi:hypothetical protein
LTQLKRLRRVRRANRWRGEATPADGLLRRVNRFVAEFGRAVPDPLGQALSIAEPDKLALIGHGHLLLTVARLRQGDDAPKENIGQSIFKIFLFYT